LTTRSTELDELEEISIESESEPRITVQIVGARGIRRGDWFPGSGHSDCYCSVRLQGEPECFYKTRAKQHDRIDPLWREELVIILDSFADNLEFSVWERFAAEGLPAGSSSRLVGSCVLASGECRERGFNGELQLKGGPWSDASPAHLALKVRGEGQRYPPGPDSTFSVSFRRGSELPLGLDVDTQHEAWVYVASIGTGPFQFYNLNAEERNRVMPGYYIVAVNGLVGDSEELLKIMERDTSLNLLIRRSVELTIAVEKRSRREPLGLAFARNATHDNLLITEVSEGPVQAWNDAQPGLAVHAGDRVIAIGGHRGKASDLRRRMRDLERFLMTVVRPCGP